MLHPNAGGPVAAHGMAYQPAACALGQGAEVGVDIGYDALCDESLEVAGGHRV